MFTRAPEERPEYIEFRTPSMGFTLIILFSGYGTTDQLFCAQYLQNSILKSIRF